MTASEAERLRAEKNVEGHAAFSASCAAWRPSPVLALGSTWCCHNCQPAAAVVE